jgi:hypothetical protein
LPDSFEMRSKPRFAIAALGGVFAQLGLPYISLEFCHPVSVAAAGILESGLSGGQSGSDSGIAGQMAGNSGQPAGACAGLTHLGGKLGEFGKRGGEFGVRGGDRG